MDTTMSRKIVFQALLLAALWQGLNAKARAKPQYYTAQTTPATPVTIQNYNIQGPVKLAHDNAQVHVNDYNVPPQQQQRPPTYTHYVDAAYPPPQNREPPYIVVAYNADLRNAEPLPASPAAAVHHANSNSAPIHRPYYVTAPYYNNHQGYQAPVYNGPVTYQGYPQYSQQQQQVRPAYQDVPVYHHQPVHRAPQHQQSIAAAPLYQPQRVNQQQQQPQPWVQHSPSQTVVYNATHSAVKQQANVVEIVAKPHHTMPDNILPPVAQMMKPQVNNQVVMKAVAPPTVSKIIVQATPQLPVDDAVDMAGKGQVVLLEPHPTLMPMTSDVLVNSKEAMMTSGKVVNVQVEQVVAAQPVKQPVQQTKTSTVSQQVAPAVVVVAGPVEHPVQQKEMSTVSDQMTVVVAEPVEQPMQQKVTSAVYSEVKVTADEPAVSSESATTTEREMTTEATPTTVATPLTELAESEVIVTEEPTKEEMAFTESADLQIATAVPATEAAEAVQEIPAEPSSAPETNEQTSTTTTKSPPLPLIYRKRLEAEKKRASSTTVKPFVIPLIYRSDARIAQRYDDAKAAPKEISSVPPATKMQNTATKAAEPMEETKSEDEMSEMESIVSHQVEEADVQKSIEVTPVSSMVKMQKTEEPLVKSSLPSKVYSTASRRNPPVKTVTVTKSSSVAPASPFLAKSEYVRHRQQAQKVVTEAPIDEPNSEEVLDSREEFDSREEEHEDDSYNERLRTQTRYPTYSGNRNRHSSRQQLKINNRRPYPIGYGKQAAVRESNTRGWNRSPPAISINYPARSASKSRVKHQKMMASSDEAQEEKNEPKVSSCTLLDEIKEALLSDEERPLPQGVVVDHANNRAILPGGFFVYYMEQEEADSHQI